MLSTLRGDGPAEVHLWCDAITEQKFWAAFVLLRSHRRLASLRVPARWVEGN